jgi:EAL domain-containing protein (putative c-di-GMP-specific phosphodiesterase class I)
MEALRAEGFGEGQGYLIGRPMPRSDAELFIADRSGQPLLAPAARPRAVKKVA